MADYIATLAQLTDEEQRIRTRRYLEPTDLARLAKIAQARELLWNAERARKAGAPLADVPLDGWRCDRTGFVMARPRRDRSVERGPRIGPRELPKGVERIRSGRIRATVAYRRDQKLSLGTFDNTPEQIDLAGRMAAAAREARDAGGTPGAVQAAAMQVYQQEEHRYAAD